MEKEVRFVALPKVELHLHLDCSMSYEVVKKIDPSISYETFSSTFIAPPKCNDLSDYLIRANQQVVLMQTQEQLRLVTLDLIGQLRAENVVYAEIRFAPLLHINKGLTSEEVVSIVNETVGEETQKGDIKIGLILATLRHYSEEKSMETVKLVEQFQGTHVVGFDIAADEAGFPIDNHIRAFEYAHKNGLNITAHAGEAKGAESVWETLEHFHPSRIGHGVRSVEDPQLMTFLKEKGIHLEVCPTSNVQTNVVDQIEDHPADKIYKTGISMGINTDARTISNTTLTREYNLLADHFHWTIEDLKKCNLEAIEKSFADEQTKAAVKEMIQAAYK